MLEILKKLTKNKPQQLYYFTKEQVLKKFTIFHLNSYLFTQPNKNQEAQFLG